MLPRYMRGEWRGDVLRLSMSFESRADAAIVQAEDDRDVSVPVQFTMEQGDEKDFLATCGKLSAAG